MHSPLDKYKLGFLVIGVLMLGFSGYFIVQSLVAKKDAKLYTEAQSIADKVNSYVRTNSLVPDSLAAVGTKDISKEITYDKLSDEKYKFCVSYHAAKNTSPSVAAASLMMYFYFGSRFGDGYQGSYTSTETLNIPSDHTKGKNCQTITPYMYSGYDYTENKDSADNYAEQTLCGETYTYSWSYTLVNSIVPKNGAMLAQIKSGSAQESTFDISNDAKIFDKNCNSIALSSLAPNDWVSIYFNPYGDPVTMIVKEY